MANNYPTVRKYGYTSELMAIIGYTIPTFILVMPAFYTSYISNEFQIPYYTVFIIIGSPFIGRFLGAYLYSKFRFLGTPFSYSMFAIGILSIAMAFEKSVTMMAMDRFLIGISFGIVTSFAVEVAVRTRNQIVIGLTTGGWALGWILSAIVSMYMPFKYALLVSGISIPLSLLGLLIRNVPIGHVISTGFNFSPYSFLIYFLAFEPAFVLEIAPKLLGSTAFVESLIAYLVAIPAYMVFPILGKRYGFKNMIYVTSVVTIISSIFFFIFLSLEAAVVFTVMGLTVNAIIPGFLRSSNIDPEKIGPSLNFSAINGFITPTLVYVIGYPRYSSLSLTLLSMTLLLALAFSRISLGSHMHSFGHKRSLRNHE
ncbi:hypothetical protein [Thermoplasma volcanium GSS1]|uniref:Transporter n=1 Tax=Thermoplasma volcanium (strain ATCC 51530 / DSM 4299 / JCM 9571 / NBRC 15438 / GSS1) TaxID=273116 RepID=Q97C49_THEVO|nr:MFS transporter permease [Thermoplasma volcanium]BAB59398.1 hypothetical protein [Thermoplasma volcanium GSS1]